MDPKIKASFIPDQVSAQKGKQASRKSSGGSLGDVLILIAIVALAAALALGAGVFLYDTYLDAQVESKEEQLARAQRSLEVRLIEELLRLDTRLDAAGQVLAQHLAPTELFTILENTTLQSVSYETLNLLVDDDNTITLTMEGRAGSVNSVALQASVLGESTAITNPIFSDLDLIADSVTFQVTANINPAALRYVNVFNQSGAPALPGIPQLPPAETQVQTTTPEEAEDLGGFAPDASPTP